MERLSTIQPSGRGYGTRRNAILDYLKRRGEGGATANAIGEATGAPIGTITGYLWEFSKRGLVEHIGYEPNGNYNRSIYRLTRRDE